jgi:hypothetical protein
MIAKFRVKEVRGNVRAAERLQTFQNRLFYIELVTGKLLPIKRSHSALTCFSSTNLLALRKQPSFCIPMLYHRPTGLYITGPSFYTPTYFRSRQAQILPGPSIITNIYPLPHGPILQIWRRPDVSHLIKKLFAVSIRVSHLINSYLQYPSGSLIL